MGWEKNSIFKYYISYGIVLLLAISISANEIDNSIKDNKKAFEKIPIILITIRLHPCRKIQS